MEEIRVATREDFNYIMVWLKEEFDNQGNNFYYNKNIIEGCLKDRTLYVYKINSKPVGYITGPLHSPAILNIKKDFQGRGIGSKLYQFTELKAKDHDICVVEVECNPKESEKFWKKQGFEIYFENFKIYGRKVLNYDLVSPIGEEIEVNITVYEGDALYQENVEPYRELNLRGILIKNKVYFEKRLIFPKFEVDDFKDVVLKISVNNKKLFFEKAKRDQAQEIGIQKKYSDFFIDYLVLPEILVQNLL